jgi:hypothetical protein
VFSAIKTFFAAFGVIGGVAFLVALCLVVPIGWVLNIVHLAHVHSFDPLTIKLVLMLIGVIFPPLGAVMGWMGFFA